MRRLAARVGSILRARFWYERVKRLGFAENRDSTPCAFCGQARGAIARFARETLRRFRAVPGAVVAFLGRPGERRRTPRADAGTATLAKTFRPRSYPGSRARRYELYVPSGCTDRKASPLVMVLHGCRQTHGDIGAISAFNALAETERFVVVYPFVTDYADLRISNCWGWWRSQEISPGAGEVEDLWQIVEEVRHDVAVDADRIHVAGLSSGGGMAVAAMVVHCDKIASGAVVAGVPYAETARAVAGRRSAAGAFRPVAEISKDMDAAMGETKRLVPIFIVHSHHDSVVDLRAAENIRESWAECFGVDTSRRVSTRAGTTHGVDWEHKRYFSANRRSAIETLFLEGVGHGWYGGGPGKFSYPDAPNVTEHIWHFLKRHPL